MQEMLIKIVIPNNLMISLSKIVSFVGQQLNEKLKKLPAITGRRQFRYIEFQRIKDFEVTYLVSSGEVLNGKQHRVSGSRKEKRAI